MIERQSQRSTGGEDFTLASLQLSWCSDCRGNELFERPPLDAPESRYAEWACTACGAAYFDGIDVVLEVDVVVRQRA